MKCLNCNHNLPDDSEFCQYCGSKIEMTLNEENANESTDYGEENIPVTNEEEGLDDSEGVDIDDMTPEEAMGLLLGIHAKQTVKEIEANAKSQPNHENDSDFGLVPEKPIYTLGEKSVDGEIEFLNSLCTSDGEKIKWERRGSLSAKGVHGMIDVYDTYLLSGQSYKTIYINMYGAKRSTIAPVGFALNDSASLKLSNLKKEKKHKKRYCSRCGSVIDKQTKICTGCGRKHFKIRLNKFSVTIIIMSVVIIALSALCVVLFFSASAETDMLKTRMIMLEEQVISQKSTIEDLEKENVDIRKQSFEEYKERTFYRDHAVIVSNDGTRKYHKYGCDDLDTSSFWIYNTEAAEGKGYYACPKCCD